MADARWRRFRATTSLTYFFPKSANDYQGYPAIQGFRPFNADQREAAIKALKFADGVSGLEITKAANGASANLRFGEVKLFDLGDGQGLTPPGGDPSSAEANPPSPEFPDFGQATAGSTPPSITGRSTAASPFPPASRMSLATRLASSMATPTSRCSIPA